MNNSPSINIVVIGQGAIGSLWSYYLSKNKAFNLTTFSSQGIATTKVLQPFTFTDINGLSFSYSTTQTTARDLANAHILLVCVKSFLIAETFNILKKHLSKHCDIILCHNGMGVVERLNSQISEHQNLYTMLMTHGGFRPTKYHAIHTGWGQCDLGHNSEQANIKLPRWFNELNLVLPNIYWQQNIKQKQWLKLATNCVINPITAINNIKNGAINDDKYHNMIQQLAKEIAMIAQNEGVSLTTKTIIETVQQVAEKTQSNTSSMLADIQAGRITEIDNINGYITQLANQYKLHAPLNNQLVTQVKALLK